MVISSVCVSICVSSTPTCAVSVAGTSVVAADCFFAGLGAFSAFGIIPNSVACLGPSFFSLPFVEGPRIRSVKDYTERTISLRLRVLAVSDSAASTFSKKLSLF